MSRNTILVCQHFKTINNDPQSGVNCRCHRTTGSFENDSSCRYLVVHCRCFAKLNAGEFVLYAETLCPDRIRIPQQNRAGRPEIVYIGRWFIKRCCASPIDCGNPWSAKRLPHQSHKKWGIIEAYLLTNISSFDLTIIPWWVCLTNQIMKNLIWGHA